MKMLPSVAIIALVFNSVGFAQSLADVARRVRAERQRSTIEGTLYTTEAIRSSYGSRVLSPAGSGDADQEAVLAEIQRIETELGNTELGEEDRARLSTELAAAERLLLEMQTEPEEPALTDLEVSAGSPPGGTVDGEVPLEGEDTDQDVWQNAVAEQRTQVRALEDSEVLQLLELTRVRGLVTAPTGSQQERNRAQSELAIGLVRLSDIRAALDQARIELEQLLAEFPTAP